MAKAKTKAAATEKAAPAQAARLRAQYREAIVPALMKQFGYKTSMQVPAHRQNRP